VVYALGNGLVLKVAFNKVGQQQNINERNTFRKAVLLNDYESFCPVLMGSSNILVMPKVEIWKDNNMAALEKYTENPGSEIITKYKEWNSFYEKLCAVFIQYVEIPDDVEISNDDNRYDKRLKYTIDHFINCYDLSANDLCRISSWGLYKGHYVLIDYGLSIQLAMLHHIGFKLK